MRVIANNTPMHGPSLCLACKNATIARGQAESQIIIYCHEFGGRMTFPIVECNEFALKGTMTMLQMEAMAHILEKHRDGKFGFRKMKPEEKTY